MSELPQLTEADVRHWVGSGSFQRGKRYFSRGHILDPRRQGNVLRAECKGSTPIPYRLQVTLGDDGIESGYCSCPVGAEGDCKHIAALLLHWIHRPSDFGELPPLEALLQQHSKEELIILIKRMLARDPELESLLLFPVASGKEGDKVDAEIIQKEVRRICSLHFDDGWEAAVVIATQLGPLVAIGDEYLQQGSWWNAATVYGAIVQEVLAQYESLYDEQGHLLTIANRCLARLGECLDQLQDADEREVILLSLFDAYLWDLKRGGISLSDGVPEMLLELTTAEEHQMMCEWVLDALQEIDTPEEYTAAWIRRALGGLLLELQGDEIDDETYLRICRETGLQLDLVERLIELGRVAEAVEASAGLQGFGVFDVANLLVEHGHTQEARELVLSQLQGNLSPHAKQWLMNRALADGDMSAALSLAEEIFRALPSVSNYLELAKIAQQAGQWESLRPTILEHLAAEKNYEVLTRIHIEEKNPLAALEALNRLRQTPPRLQYNFYYSYYSYDSLTLEVAKALERDHREEALQLYLKVSENLIGHRNRNSYADAAKLLRHVRQLYKKAGQQDRWEQFIADLRTTYKRLPALQDELNKAKL